MPPLGEEREAELVAAPVLIVGRHGGLPADTKVDAQMRSGPEGILHVTCDDRLAQVIGNYVAIRQAGETADQQVRQSVATGGAVEGELAVGLLVIKGIELILDRKSTRLNSSHLGIS